MKKIATTVVALHLVLVLWLVVWTPPKKQKTKSLKVHTVVQAPPPAPKETVITKAAISPAIQKKKPTPAPPIKKVAPPVKKTIPSAKPIKKTSPVSQELQKQLQESIAKFSENSHKECPKVTFEIPKQITRLEVDTKLTGDEQTFAATLVECLQHKLKLPEKGEVKVELTLKQEGQFIKMRIVETASHLNARFLEEQLPTIHYPSFTGSLKQEKEHTFVISFCHF